MLNPTKCWTLGHRHKCIHMYSSHRFTLECVHIQMTYISLLQDNHMSTFLTGSALWLRAVPSPLTLIMVCRTSASSGLFFTHTRTQGTYKEHNKSLANLALCPTSLPHKGYLTARHLAWKVGPGPAQHLLLCLKDLLTGNCLVPFYPKQEVPTQRRG